MAKIDTEVWIKASVDKIFDYISNPRNLPEFWPSLIEIKDVKSLPNSGYTIRWVYKMLGMRFEGTAEYTQIVQNRFFVIETKGGINSTIAWTVRPWENNTRVTLTIEYKIPVPLLGNLAANIILKMNEQEAALILANLKARFMEGNY